MTAPDPNTRCDEHGTGRGPAGTDHQLSRPFGDAAHRLHEGADPAHDVTRAIDIPGDALDRPRRRIEIGRSLPNQRSAAWALAAAPADRLAELMGDRAGKLAHRRNPAGVRRRSLRLAQRLGSALPAQESLGASRIRRELR